MSGPYVSRGGLKLRHALDEFRIDAEGLACADLGASTGGFTDCLLRAGARSVIAVDTAYGQLAWALRNDPRVTVIERANALHAGPPIAGDGRPRLCDLVVVDLGWTPQRLAIPAAARWLVSGGRVISLIKPHYERSARGHGRSRGVLDLAEAERITREAVGELGTMGYRVAGLVRSPIEGGGKGGGNAEWLALIEPAAPTAPSAAATLSP